MPLKKSFWSEFDLAGFLGGSIHQSIFSLTWRRVADFILRDTSTQLHLLAIS